MKKDLQNETAKTDSNYEDLTTATRTNQVYETIRKPTESNGRPTSVQGEANKNNIPVIQVFQYFFLVEIERNTLLHF